MDDFWFWASLTWNVGVAWFGTWPVLLQIAAVCAALYAAYCVCCAVVGTVVRVVRWVRGKRLTRAVRQAQRQDDEWDVAAIIESIEARLRAEREVSE